MGALRPCTPSPRDHHDMVLSNFYPATKGEEWQQLETSLRVGASILTTAISRLKLLNVFLSFSAILARAHKRKAVEGRLGDHKPTHTAAPGEGSHTVAKNQTGQYSAHRDR